MDKRSNGEDNVSDEEFRQFELLRIKWKNQPDNITAKELIKTYSSLLEGLARQWTDGADVEDLYSTASESLLKAVKQFDPMRHAKFETYARIVIESAIKDDINKHRHYIRVSREIRDDLHHLKDAASEFEREHERIPTVTELATLTGLTVKRIRRIREFEGVTYVSSLNESQELNDADWEYVTRLESQSEQEINRLEWKLSLEPLLDSLPEWQKAVIKNRFGFVGDGMTQEAVGKLFHKSQQAVQKAEACARKTLRENPQSQILAEYLLGRFSDTLRTDVPGSNEGESQANVIKSNLWLYTLRWVCKNRDIRILKKILAARIKALPPWMFKAFIRAYGRASPNETAVWVLENLLAMKYLRRVGGDKELMITAEGADWLDRNIGQQPHC